MVVHIIDSIAILLTTVLRFYLFFLQLLQKANLGEILEGLSNVKITLSTWKNFPFERRSLQNPNSVLIDYSMKLWRTILF